MGDATGTVPKSATPAYRIRFMTEAESATDEHLIPAITDLVNEVYQAAEKGQWNPEFSRTTPEDIKCIITSAQLVIAFSSEDRQPDMIDSANILGVVNLQLLPRNESLPDSTSELVGEFGMLAVPDRHRSLGLGRALVDYAEGWAREKGAAIMQLEILTPRDWIQPSKEFLFKWYGRRGYKAIRKQPFEQMHPRLVPLLATDCDYTVWEKNLVHANGNTNGLV